MTASGTFETCRRALKMSALQGRPEMQAHGPNDAIDPSRTFADSPMIVLGAYTSHSRMHE